MKSNYRHWSDANIYVQMRKETNLAETGSADRLRRILHFNEANNCTYI